MKRKRITLKKKIVATLKPKQLKTVTGGKGGSGKIDPTSCGSDTTRSCHGW